MLNLKGVKKAVSEVRRCRNYFRIYVDFSTGEVWEKEYISCNDFTRYKSPDIREVLHGYGTDSPMYKKVTMKAVEDAAAEEYYYYLNDKE